MIQKGVLHIIKNTVKYSVKDIFAQWNVKFKDRIFVVLDHLLHTISFIRKHEEIREKRSTVGTHRNAYWLLEKKCSPNITNMMFIKHSKFVILVSRNFYITIIMFFSRQKNVVLPKIRNVVPTLIVLLILLICRLLG